MLMSSWTRERRSLLLTSVRCSRKPSATLSATFSHGSSVSFWKTIDSECLPGARASRRAERGEDREQRRLAAAAWSHYPDDLPAVHCHGDAVENRGAAAVLEAHVFQQDHGVVVR